MSLPIFFLIKFFKEVSSSISFQILTIHWTVLNFSSSCNLLVCFLCLTHVNDLTLFKTNIFFTTENSCLVYKYQLNDLKFGIKNLFILFLIRKMINDSQIVCVFFAENLQFTRRLLCWHLPAFCLENKYVLLLGAHVKAMESSWLFSHKQKWDSRRTENQI